MVGEGHYEVEFVFDEQDGVALGTKVLDLVEDLSRFGRVHAGGRFVEKEEPGSHGEGAGDLGAAAVRVRQREGEVVLARQQALSEAAELPLDLGFLRGLFAADAARADQREDQFGEQRQPAGDGDVAQRGERTGGAGARVHPDQDVLADGHVAENAAVLEGAGDTDLGDLFGRASGRWLAEDPDIAVVGSKMTADQVEERRLAGAVRTDDADGLTR